MLGLPIAMAVTARDEYSSASSAVGGARKRPRSQPAEKASAKPGRLSVVAGDGREAARVAAKADATPPSRPRRRAAKPLAPDHPCMGPHPTD